jgi:hypothetical protein
MEPTAVRKYTPLQLESREKASTQQTKKKRVISKNKEIYPSLTTKIANFTPHLTFNQN